MLGSDGSASESDDEEAATHEAPRPVWIVGSTAGQSSLDDAIVSNGDTGTGRFNATFQLVCCVLTWYVLSITLTLGNKMIFSGGKGITAALPCPLIITALHIGMKVPLARFGMRHAGLQQISFGSWSAWLARIAPVGLAAALDIGLSNASLVYITVTQYTVVKSSAPMWILMISVALGLQKPKPALVLVVLSIASGIALASQPPTLAEQVGTQMTGNLVEEVAGSSSLQSGKNSLFNVSLYALYFSLQIRSCCRGVSPKISADRIPTVKVSDISAHAPGSRPPPARTIRPTPSRVSTLRHMVPAGRSVSTTTAAH